MERYYKKNLFITPASYFIENLEGQEKENFKNVYEWVCREIFFESNTKWNESKNGFFEDEEGFHKRFLEDYFHIKL